SAKAVRLAAQSTDPHLAGRRGRLQQKPKRYVAVGKSSRRRTQSASQPLHRQEPDATPFIYAQKSVAFHVSVLRVFRHPQLGEWFSFQRFVLPPQSTVSKDAALISVRW